MRINLKKLGRVPVPEAVSIPLDRCYLCSDCMSIGNDSRKCAACAGASIFALSRFIPDHRDTLRLRTPQIAPKPHLVRFLKPISPLCCIAGKKA